MCRHVHCMLEGKSTDVQCSHHLTSQTGWTECDMSVMSTMCSSAGQSLILSKPTRSNNCSNQREPWLWVSKFVITGAAGDTQSPQYVHDSERENQTAAMPLTCLPQQALPQVLHRVARLVLAEGDASAGVTHSCYCCSEQRGYSWSRKRQTHLLSESDSCPPERSSGSTLDLALMLQMLSSAPHTS